MPNPAIKLKQGEGEGEPAAQPGPRAAAQVHRDGTEEPEGASTRRLLYTVSDGSARLKVFAPKIARGSFGAVYRGILQRDGDSERLVAVKLMCQKNFESAEEFSARARSIAVKMSQPMLASPNIIHLLHSFERPRPPCHWLAMELADRDFFEVLAAAYRGTPFEGLHPGSTNFTFLLSDVLQGLATMHMHGYLHRDIKPENILIAWDADRKRHRAIIADLDFLCNVVPAAEATPLECGDRPGTLLYQPPEFWSTEPDGGEDGKTDVFATAMTFLGITLTGPWGSRFDQMQRLERKKKETDFADVRNVVEEMADAAFDMLRKNGPILKVLSHMIHPDVDRRCTAMECSEELTAALQELGEEIGDDAAEIAHMDWHLGEVWPMALDGVVSRFFRKLFRPWP